jgi:filamentous hemagglutinin
LVSGETRVIGTGKTAANDASFDGAKDLTTNLSEVWTLKPSQRGVDIESYLAKTEYSPQSGWYKVGAERNGYFPLVDFQNGNTLVSLKSVDTAGSTWLGRMQDHIIDLGTNGAKVNGVPANMVLDLRVQPSGSAAAKGKRGRIYLIFLEVFFRLNKSVPFSVMSPRWVTRRWTPIPPFKSRKMQGC